MIKNATISLQTVVKQEDEDLNIIEKICWSKSVGCTIAPNSKASQITLEDGYEDSTSYDILLNDVKCFGRIPNVGDYVRVVKNDSTLNTKRRILGVTTKGHWLKIWI